MAYATLDKLRGMIASLTLDETSKPNQAQAEQMLDDVSDEIDATLSGYGVVIVPATTPNWFTGKLALLNAYGAAAMVLKAAFPSSGGPGSDASYAFWEGRYQKGLSALRGSMPPELLVEVDTGSGGLASGTHYEDYEGPIFTVGKLF